MRRASRIRFWPKLLGAEATDASSYLERKRSRSVGAQETKFEFESGAIPLDQAAPHGSLRRSSRHNLAVGRFALEEKTRPALFLPSHVCRHALYQSHQIHRKIERKIVCVHNRTKRGAGSSSLQDSSLPERHSEPRKRVVRATQLLPRQMMFFHFPGGLTKVYDSAARSRWPVKRQRERVLLLVDGPLLRLATLAPGFQKIFEA